jgi:hypothetical protein
MEEAKNTEESRHEEIQFLKSLAVREIQRIERLPQPVVRVCGPLTCDGPEGYERNAKRLADAEKILQSQGKTVWTFGEAEGEIFNNQYLNQASLRKLTSFHDGMSQMGQHWSEIVLKRQTLLFRNFLKNGFL